MNCGDKLLYRKRNLLLTDCSMLSQGLFITKAWISILLLIFFILTSSMLHAAEASEETIAMFRTVIEAVNHIEHPVTGKGSALVETYVENIPSMTGEWIFDFIFKGDMSRSVKSSIEEDNHKQPEVLWAVGEKCSVISNYKGGVSVQHNPPHQFYRQLGYDFNPRTFIVSYSTPLAVHLERVLNGPATLSTKTDSEGILHLISDYKDPNVYQHHVISVDPNMGYRLVSNIGIMERIDRPSRNHTDFFEVQWDKYESSWYVKSAKFSSYAGIHSPEDRSSLEPGILRRSTTVNVTEFHPNVEVNISVFTLDGLKLPAGTSVVDKISGSVYRIHRDQSSIDKPKKPLTEAESPNSVKNEVNSDNEEQDTTAIDKQIEVTKKHEQEIPISEEKPIQETLLETKTAPHSYENILMISVLSIGIIMVIAVIVMGMKLLLSRNA